MRSLVQSTSGKNNNVRRLISLALSITLASTPLMSVQAWETDHAERSSTLREMAVEEDYGLSKYEPVRISLNPKDKKSTAKDAGKDKEKTGEGADLPPPSPDPEPGSTQAATSVKKAVPDSKAAAPNSAQSVKKPSIDPKAAPAATPPVKNPAEPTTKSLKNPPADSKTAGAASVVPPVAKASTNPSATSSPAPAKPVVRARMSGLNSIEVERIHQSPKNFRRARGSEARRSEASMSSAQQKPQGKPVARQSSITTDLGKEPPSTVTSVTKKKKSSSIPSLPSSFAKEVPAKKTVIEGLGKAQQAKMDSSIVPPAKVGDVMPPLAPSIKKDSSGSDSHVDSRIGAPNKTAPQANQVPTAPHHAKSTPHHPTTTTSTGHEKTAPSWNSTPGTAASTGSTTRINRPGAPQKPTSSDPAPQKAKEDVRIERPAAPDSYPSVGKLEQVMFGSAHPEKEIGERLTNLEYTVFAKTHESDSLFDRTERLKKTILGTDGGGNTAYGVPPSIPKPMSDPSSEPTTGQDSEMESDLAYLDDLISRPENSSEAPQQVLESFALELINYERQRRGVDALSSDDLAQRMANTQLQDLVKRSVVSHTDSKGDNPDRRYTLLGGTDAINESLVTVDTSQIGYSKPTKAAVALALKQLYKRQDDREFLLSPAATHVALSIATNGNGSKLLACVEVLTRRGAIQPVAVNVHPGDKVEIEGVINAPFVFDRITVAWEGAADPSSMVDDEPEEALPYFPPLDFIAYREKSQKDYSKAMTAFKAAGLVAVIAGGMFMPPVALAAPLIVMAGSGGGDPKPMSDIPVRGGVRVDGSNFSKSIKMSNDGKAGLYYVTVWAASGEGSKPVAISRRTILATTNDQIVHGESTSTVQESKPDDLSKGPDKKDTDATSKTKNKKQRKQKPDSDKAGKDKDAKSDDGGKSGI